MMMRARSTLTFAAFLLAAALRGQQPMGTVASRAALVTGGLEVQGDSIRLLANTSITAYEQTAAITLARGGEVLVCATSQFHLLHSGTGPSLLFALDRGAVELRSTTQPQDMLLTPDLRFTFGTSGQLDLRIRVTQEGDTCVENAGAGAPTLEITDVFSSTSYRLTPGQHVLFEHGSLHEVVDRETSPCGCPAAAVPAQQLAAGGGSPAEISAAEHPFPVAISQGLARPAEPVADVSGEQRTQVLSVLTAGSPPAEAPAATIQRPVAPAIAAAEPPPAPPGATDLAHMVGRLWHKLFHRKSQGRSS